MATRYYYNVEGMKWRAREGVGLVSDKGAPLTLCRKNGYIISLVNKVYTLCINTEKWVHMSCTLPKKPDFSDPLISKAY